MADLRPQFSEEAVGANHPTKTDVINRAYNVEHDEDGTHGAITPTSVTTPNATVSTSLNLTGGQIAFPAGAVPSADPNTLDDYEEGTWTPAVGGNATYTTQDGTYTKIGRIVNFQAQIVINVLGTGGQTLTDFPFACGFTNAEFSVYFSGLALTTISLMGMMNVTTINCNFYGLSIAAATLGASLNVFGNGANIYVSGSYRI